jgi:hypothetical protein
MTTHYNLLRFTATGDLDISAIVQELRSRFPHIQTPVRSWIDAVRKAVADAQNCEEVTLFVLVRYLKANLKLQQRDMPSDSLFPYALLFCDLCEYEQLGQVGKMRGGDFECYDQSALQVVFEATWDEVLFGIDENILILARKFAQEMNPEDSPELTNSHVRILLGICKYFQKVVGKGKAFLLPQERLADTLDCSQQLISSCVAILKKKGYLKLVSDANPKAKKAATYLLSKPRKQRLISSSIERCTNELESLTWN